MSREYGGRGAGGEFKDNEEDDRRQRKGFSEEIRKAKKKKLLRVFCYRLQGTTRRY